MKLLKLGQNHKREPKGWVSVNRFNSMLAAFMKGDSWLGFCSAASIIVFESLFPRYLTLNPQRIKRIKVIIAGTFYNVC